MLQRIIQSKSKTFLAFCFCFLGGVAAASLSGMRVDTLYGLVVCLILIMISMMLRDNPAYCFVALGLLFISIGLIRYSLAFPSGLSFPGSSTVHLADRAESGVAFISYVSAEPDVRMDGVRYIVRASHVRSSEVKSEAASNPWLTTDGRVYLKTNLYPRFRYGDRLLVSCRLRRPEPIEDFRYDMFLARYGVFVTCSHPSVAKVGERYGNPAMRAILRFKERVAERINVLWHEPHASFMAGLLYGYRGGLGSLNELFSRTGVTHIVAISGYNITIISSILIGLCIRLLIPRQKAFWCVVSGIGVFVIFAGLSASVVRAGIMGIMVLISKQLGRASRAGNVMVFTAVIMTLHNPLILVWDAGFQLSFISTLGLIYVTGHIEPYLTWVTARLQLRESMVSTLAAITATLPLILYQFGRLSIVAPAVNVLILWIIPWMMMAGFITVLVSFVFLPLAHGIAWIGHGGLTYIILVVEWFARMPFAAIDFSVPWWVMAASYICGAVYMIKHTKTK